MCCMPMEKLLGEPRIEIGTARAGEEVAESHMTIIVRSITDEAQVLVDVLGVGEFVPVERHSSDQIRPY